MNLWYTAPHNQQGTDSKKVTYNTAPRRRPVMSARVGSATLPPDPSIGERICPKSGLGSRHKPLSASKLAALTKRYGPELESLLSVDEGVSRSLLPGQHRAAWTTPS